MKHRFMSNLKEDLQGFFTLKLMLGYTYKISIGLTKYLSSL